MLTTFSREEFLTRRWRYRKGEHVTVVGPTGCGKTVLCYQLIAATARQSLPVVALVKKPRDHEIRRWAKELKLPIVRTWPPAPRLPWQRKPLGWVLWPKTNFDDVKASREHQAAVFRRALMHSYKRGDRLVYVDDTYGISEILGLDDELIELWTELRSMDGGLWTSFQKPTHVPTWAYGQAAHLMLFNDPDRRTRDRFAEIGGVDPDLVRDTVLNLDEHQALYIRRAGRRMCIIDA